MSRDRDLVATARSALVGYLGDGRFGWGRPLPVSELASDLRLSPTPVREALAHLAGEGLIEHAAGRGYFAPRPTPSDIEELYNLHRLLVMAALDGLVALPEPDADLWEAGNAEAAFAEIVRSGNNRLVAQEYERAAARLRQIRSVEAAVAPLPQAIATMLSASLKASDIRRLREAIDHYHDDRIGKAHAVFSAMRSAANSIDQI